MRAPEWNVLCWLVEKEREGKGRRKIALCKRIFPRSSSHPAYIKEVLVAGPSELACHKDP
jgi:hypothetical protein